jgi:hypothetical protein
MGFLEYVMYGDRHIGLRINWVDNYRCFSSEDVQYHKRILNYQDGTYTKYYSDHIDNSVSIENIEFRRSDLDKTYIIFQKPVSTMNFSKLKIKDKVLYTKKFGMYEKMKEHTAEGDIVNRLYLHMLCKVKNGPNGHKYTTKKQNKMLASFLYRKAYHIATGMIEKCLKDAIGTELLRTIRRYNLQKRCKLYRTIRSYGDNGYKIQQIADKHPYIILSKPADEALFYGSEVMEMITHDIKINNIVKSLNIPRLMTRFKSPRLIEEVNKNIIYRIPTIEDIVSRNNNFIDLSKPLNTIHGLNHIRENTNKNKQINQWIYKNANILGSKKYRKEYFSSVLDYMQCDEGNPYRELIPKKFNAKMDVKTVFELSKKWHDDINKYNEKQQEIRDNIPFQDPWITSATINNISILPVTNKRLLFQEGGKMNHCCYSYSSRIIDGESYVYSVRTMPKESYPALINTISCIGASGYGFLSGAIYQSLINVIKTKRIGTLELGKTVHGPFELDIQSAVITVDIEKKKIYNKQFRGKYNRPIDQYFISIVDKWIQNHNAKSNPYEIRQCSANLVGKEV